MRLHDLLLSSLFCVVILTMAGLAAERVLPFDVPANLRLLNGEWSRTFEAHYDKVFPVRTFGTNLWAALQLELFGEGRAGVVIGRRGWLFTSEEFDADELAPARIDAHLAFIAQARDRLSRQGTQLVVALVPAKARIYPEFLGAQQPSPLHRALYARARDELLHRGIRAPDLASALSACKARSAVFLRTDTHWTPAGAHCSADALKDAAALPDTPAQAFHTQFEAPRQHQGDLLRFLPLAPYFAALLPEPDVLAPSTTQMQSDDLLGETAPPQIVLVGTSYSADERWNFDGALREVLAEDVLNLAEVGRGPFAPMLAYLAHPPAVTPPARLIWEIPERYLPAGKPMDHLGEQQKVAHSMGSAPTTDTTQENST